VQLLVLRDCNHSQCAERIIVTDVSKDCIDFIFRVLTRKVTVFREDLNLHFIELACHDVEKSVSQNFHLNICDVRRTSVDFPVVNPVAAVSDLFKATFPENQ